MIRSRTSQNSNRNIFQRKRSAKSEVDTGIGGGSAMDEGNGGQKSYGAKNCWQTFGIRKKRPLQ